VFDNLGYSYYNRAEVMKQEGILLADCDALVLGAGYVFGLPLIMIRRKKAAGNR
jgi:hypothetical protein